MDHEQIRRVAAAQRREALLLRNEASQLRQQCAAIRRLDADMRERIRQQHQLATSEKDGM